MKILFHVAVGNTDRPSRWQAIGRFYTDLAESFETLGHDCFMVIHKSAVTDGIFEKNKVVNKVAKLKGHAFRPDVVFTWNGISDGDRQMIDLYGAEKFIYSELGFFDHYKTCYFDFSGTNFTSMNLVEDLSDVRYEQAAFDQLVENYQKDRLYEGRYIFVPLQDEGDTQITKLSPFKTMKAFLEYVLQLYAFDKDLKILFKKHPSAPCEVPEDDRLVEVFENVHHYLPYAENVVGVNSTVLFETLLYHQRILSVGLGIASRRFNSDEERKSFIMNCLAKQLYHTELADPKVIEKSWFYKKMISTFSLE